MGSIGSINNLSAEYLPSILSYNQNNNVANSTTVQPENGSHLSPFMQVLTTLQQLEQSNPSQYQQVTGQIATNLKNAAQTATADGNSVLGAELGQLSTDFSSASQSGQLPNIQDLAQAIGSGHHHYHHFHAGSNDALTIITDTLSSAGINLGN